MNFTWGKVSKFKKNLNLCSIKHFIVTRMNFLFIASLNSLFLDFKLWYVNKATLLTVQITFLAAFSENMPKIIRKSFFYDKKGN